MNLNFEYFKSLWIHLMESINLSFEAISCIWIDTSSCNPSETTWESIVNFINNWQTMITGILAIIPASAAAIFVWKQLNEQRLQFLQLEKRDSQKSRLRLSRNLAEISSYLDGSYALLIKKKGLTQITSSNTS